MKSKKIKHKHLNGGKETEVFWTVADNEFELFFNEIYEEEHYLQGLRYLKNKFNDPKNEAVVMDVGANVGLATLFFAPHVKKVYSFEPSPVVFEALKKNTEKLKNVEVHNVGLSIKEQRVLMVSKKPGSPPQEIYYGGEFRERIEADFMDISTLMDKHNIDHVDLFKFDAEGVEYEVFPTDSFARASKKIDAIIGEGHVITPAGSSNSIDPEFIPVMLEEYGYQVRFLETNKPYAKKHFTHTHPDTGIVKHYELPIDALYFAEK